MRKLFALFIPAAIAALILPYTIFAAGEYRHDHPTELILTETTSLYDTNEASTRLSTMISPQTVNVTDAWVYTPNWYEIDTWLGKKWIYTLTAIPHEPNFEKTKFQLYDTFYLYDGPYTNQWTEASISPQVVETLDIANGYYQISTWLGNKWIKSPPIENRYAMTELSQIQKVDEQVNVTTITNLCKGPALSTMTANAIEPQTVQAFEKIANWYHIKSGWVGDAWIRVDAPTSVTWSGIQQSGSLHETLPVIVTSNQ